MVTRSNFNQLQTLPCMLFYFMYSCFRLSVVMAAGDTLIVGESIGITETMVSSGGEFELGFFSPVNSSTHFVGIWYKKISQRTVVWIMNRDFACISASPVMSLRPDGNLVIIEGRITYSATNISNASNATAKLLDSGNLVIHDAQNGVVLWQSFDYPTHTLLPGMKLGFDRRTGNTWALNSWRSSIDPFPGAFTMQVDPNRSSEIIINQGSKRYWTSGSWNGQTFSLVPRWALKSLKNISYFSNQEQSYFMFSGYDYGSIARISLDVSGQIKEFTWSEKTKSWNLNWSQPAQQCEVYAYCGSFANCDQNSSPFCHCFPGFVPQSPRRWDSGDKSGGCFRKVPLECERSSNESDKQDGFHKLSNVILPVNPTKIKAKSSFDCELICLNNCSCSGYSYNSDGCLIWSGDVFNLQQLSTDSKGKSFNLKLSPLELRKTRPKQKPWVWAVLVPSLFFFLLAGACTAFCVWKRKLVQGKDLLMFDFDAEFGEEVAELNHLVKDRQKDVELPLFSFASVAAATENFSAANKLGEGGFGPVYLGKLVKGQEVAVKRLSRKSGQGWEELRTEATLIAKLQHRNLVRLLGCCLEREEKILIYEYLPNKSLDSFLFDAGRRSILDWEKRFRIINGIAQGLLYLHEYSRLKIIHRDLKASNILLDKDMNPKISDFGMARIFGGDESQATNRIVGTYGYMSPEYAMDGLFSVKSDVFSFGVLLLEILSGRKNTGLYYSDSLNLLGHAWDLWRKGKELELIDPILEGSCLAAMEVRYINVALLCVQENAADRPSISDIVSMLCNESLPILTPKLPTSSILRSVMDTDSSGSIVQTHRSQAEITSITTGR